MIDTPVEESVEPEEPVDSSLNENIYYKKEDDEEYDEEVPSNLPESIVLPLPSNIVSFKLRPSFESLISTERELQKGQANDALEGLCIVYQKLKDKDLVVIKDITKAKCFGQGGDSLAWFWRIGPSEDELTGEWMEECESN